MKRIQMSNKKYGSLTVLEFFGNGKNGARWKCRCDCGEEKIVDGYLLRRGSVKTCGCRINLKDNLIGNKYHKLIVVKEVGRHKDRSILWKCKCECGNIVVVKARSLRASETKSCGCLRKLEKGEAAINRLLRQYQFWAKKRGLSFGLSREDFKKLTRSNCHYCDSAPTRISKRKFGNGDYKYNGIDRKNNNKGYTKGNSLSCCFICNRAKGNMSYRNFRQWITKIKK